MICRTRRRREDSVSAPVLLLWLSLTLRTWPSNALVNNRQPAHNRIQLKISRVQVQKPTTRTTLTALGNSYLETLHHSVQENDQGQPLDDNGKQGREQHGFMDTTTTSTITTAASSIPLSGNEQPVDASSQAQSQQQEQLLSTTTATTKLGPRRLHTFLRQNRHRLPGRQALQNVQQQWGRFVSNEEQQSQSSSAATSTSQVVSSALATPTTATSKKDWLISWAMSGTLAYTLTTMWAITGYYELEGHWPDWTDEQVVTAVWAEAVAYGKWAGPLRFLGSVMWGKATRVRTGENNELTTTTTISEHQGDESSAWWDRSSSEDFVGYEDYPTTVDLQEFFRACAPLMNEDELYCHPPLEQAAAVMEMGE